MFMGSLIKKMFYKNLVTKIGGLLCKGEMNKIKALLDYRTIGGTQFLGIRKPVIKAHGASDVLAFRNAVKQAADAAQADFTTELEKALQKLTPEKENVHD